MPMPKPVKVGLIVLLALLVVGGGTCAGFVAWVKSNEADWRLKGQEAKKEGRDRGKSYILRTDGEGKNKKTATNIKCESVSNRFN